MSYIFKDGQLYYQGTGLYPPPDSYVYYSNIKQWFVRGTRVYLRPVKRKHVPKELLMLCLLLGVPT